MSLEKPLLEKIEKSRSGNELANRELIDKYRPYILNTVGHICKKFVTWSDDESSIGLLAFNRAISGFEPERGRTFLNFAFLLIQRDLFNFMKQRKQHHVSISFDSADETDQSAIATIEHEHSMKTYQMQAAASELVEEILELNKCLKQFQIRFDELESCSPKHSDTRQQLSEMARAFMEHRELIDEMLKKKRFPASAFVGKAGYSLKTVERYRKYLITIIFIHLHPEWTHLASFIKVKGGTADES